MVIVISNPDPLVDESTKILSLFEAGLETFHMRKKEYTENEIKILIERIPSEYYKKIVIHSHYHLAKEYGLKGIHVPASFLENQDNYQISISFHNTKEIEDCSLYYMYGFLSPVFESISKKGYKPSLQLENISDFLKQRKEKIIALGGIDENKIELLKDIGFSGIAVLGAVWESENPVYKYKSIRNKWINQ